MERPQLMGAREKAEERWSAAKYKIEKEPSSQPLVKNAEPDKLGV